MLTEKQYQLLEFLCGRIRDQGIAPSYEEMKTHMGLHSKSGIHRLVSGLEERGFIRRLNRRARAIEIMRRPPLKESRSSRTETPQESFAHVPMFGSIAAGTPVEALARDGPPISMTGAGIHDGDMILIRRAETAPPGTVVVALVDGCEVTLKRLEYDRDSGEVLLIAENPDYGIQRYASDRVQIQGRLSGLIRMYEN